MAHLLEWMRIQSMSAPDILKTTASQSNLCKHIQTITEWLGLEGTPRIIKFQLLPQAGPPTSRSGTRPGCPGPHTTCSKTPPGMGHPQPLWAYLDWCIIYYQHLQFVNTVLMGSHMNFSALSPTLKLGVFSLWCDSTSICLAWEVHPNNMSWPLIHHQTGTSSDSLFCE